MNGWTFLASTMMQGEVNDAVLYLSRLILNQANAAVRRDMSDCQHMHRTVMRAFPVGASSADGARATMGVLYRLDHNKTLGAPMLLVQSRAMPEWTSLPTGYLFDTEPDFDNPACRDISGVYQQLEIGHVLAFRLLANPTRKTNTSLKSEREDQLTKRNGNRVFIAEEREQLEWLTRKAIASGFELVTANVAGSLMPDIQIGDGQHVNGRKRLPDSAGTIRELTLRGCVFTGRLRIVDKGQFAKALVGGIGSGKAYGFGLLSVARPRTRPDVVS